ncbi:MAG: hypothetical protein COX29_02660 [Candidatus Moranbacteria bacterium CG23_combo_of_CG06-09_8_20_14_all_35_22]|nr:MAG: hypothetical protein COX29_02660 [Candidatus Moranbacteria bacterium CG23_combo_of_CG06-09_8_20_14_all_35_22]
MLEKINFETIPNKIENDKFLEKLNDFSKDEIELLNKMHGGKFEKARKAFLAITAGVMLLSTTGCGIPYLMQVGEVEHGGIDLSMGELILGPAAHPVEVTEALLAEIRNDGLHFYKDELFLTLHYKKPILYGTRTKRIIDDLEKNNWPKIENEECASCKLDEMRAEMHIMENDNGTFDVEMSSWGGSYKEGDEKRENISEENLIKNINEMISVAKK